MAKVKVVTRDGDCITIEGNLSYWWDGSRKCLEVVLVSRNTFVFNWSDASIIEIDGGKVSGWETQVQQSKAPLSDKDDGKLEFVCGHCGQEIEKEGDYMVITTDKYGDSEIEYFPTEELARKYIKENPMDGEVELSRKIEEFND